MKYLNHPFEIAIDVTRHEEIPVLIAAVDVADYVSLYTEEGKVLTKATYQVRNNVKQYLRFNLPEGSTLWSAFVSGQPVKPARDKNGSILIPLQKSQRQGESLTQFPVEVVYLDQGSKMKLLGQLKINLPRTDVPVSELRWTAYFPNDYTYFKFGGNVKKSEVRFGPLEVVGGVAREAKKVGDRVQLGEQFASTSQYSSQYEPYYNDAVQQADAAKGKLPIKIDVPEQGRSLQFSKLLVTEGESPWLSLYYSSIPNKLSVLLRLLVAAALIVVLVRILRKNKK